MTKMIFKGSSDIVLATANVTVDHSTSAENFDDVLARLLLENDLSASHKQAVSFEADDSAWHFADMGVTPKFEIPMLPNITISSEGQFGFMAKPVTTASSSIYTSKGRSYSSLPIPPVLFTTAYDTDSKSENSAMWKKPGVFIYRIRHRRYNSSSGQMDTILVARDNKLYWYFRRFEATGSWPMFVNTYSHITDNTRVNNYTLATLFSGGNTTEVTFSMISEYTPEGVWSSPEITLPDLVHYVSSSLTWTEELPVDTSAVVEVLHEGEFVAIQNGGSLPGLLIGSPMQGKKITLRVTLQSDNINATPSLTNMLIECRGFRENRYVELSIDPMSTFKNADGPLTVSYEQNLGSLVGLGGSVDTFSIPFTPTGLQPKPNPGTVSRAAVVPAVEVTLFEVTYSKAYAASSRAKATANAKITLTQVGVIGP